MKKFAEILDDIKQTSEAIKAAKTQENEMLENSERKKNLDLTRKILKNNAKIALFNEVLPVALETLAKYSGKPYGEKTRRKISDEIKEKTGCRFYIESHYGSQSFEIYPVKCCGSDYNISCGTDYTDGCKKPLLINNKIQLVTFEELALYYTSREYVEDVPRRVEELKNIYIEAVAKQKELKYICDCYNLLAVGDIQHIYYDKHIYENM